MGHLQDILFVSLGLVVLDEIRFPNREPLTDVLGGSGAYATLGARLFLPHPLSRSLGWIIHVGNDFPEHIEDRLESWDATLTIEREPSKPSTRGLLAYEDTTFGRAETSPMIYQVLTKEFKYTTPILAIQDHGLESLSLLTSQAYHYLEAPHSITARLSSLLALRENSGILARPLVIWEPAPLSCRPENLQLCLDAAAIVNVFSPNHLELATLFGEPLSTAIDKGRIESLAVNFLDSGVGPDGQGIVIVRAGEHGCVIMARNVTPVWLPPFHKSRPGEGQNAKVVDPTGAGNAFLGAFAVGYLKTGSIVEAACLGSVGASFALEQVGMPEKSNNGEKELWNGTDVFSRLNEYRRSIGRTGDQPKYCAHQS
ncbi:hypothetical protein ETB97_003304 [Aspergillus alliaceus]|uniref:Carbohydrate kinase PfkB domain-containing protein n=1 Tax=Petromyces alliaceus TaxID=209559 RepID=A0A8H6A1X2_PETAA|nr:hypothetical protein ETB97_003304 [Aspergillus burnettii]